MVSEKIPTFFVGRPETACNNLVTDADWNLEKSCPQSQTAARPNITHSGKIRLGGGCRLPLQGEPTERDRLPRAKQTRPE